MKKKFLAITGIRSEYDILYPVLDVLRKDSNFEVKVVICGAHLSEWHGFTAKKIYDDGFEVADQIDYLLSTNREVQRAKGVGLLTYSLAQTVESEKPDFLYVVGDREESIATAIVGNYMNILTVHYGGGDSVYGNSDDPIRFAVSKLAHIHFTTAKEYADNLLKLGEEEFRIFNVGNTNYYNIHNTEYINLNRLSQILNFNISDGNYIVFIKHPLSSEVGKSYEHMKIALEALSVFVNRYNFKVLGIYPNTDPGSYDILKAIEELKNDSIVFFKTLERKVFINIMRNTKALVGNSSMGILEAPFYKIPVVNIGNRQKGRLNAGNVEFVDYDIQLIVKALERAVFDESYREKIKNIINPYGDETAPYKIRDILSNIDPNDKKWYIKRKLI